MRPDWEPDPDETPGDLEHMQDAAQGDWESRQKSRSDDISVTLPIMREAIVLFIGDTNPIILDDAALGDELVHLGSIQRTVLATRLRAHADLIDQKAAIS